MSTKSINKRQFTGLVTSVSMQDSITVRVKKSKLHPLYKKVVREYKKYIAHNMMEGIQVGDQVKIIETRPVSKRKRWLVTEKIVK